MSINIPVVNASNLYLNNLNLSWVSITSITMSPGYARDSTNVNDMELDSIATILANSVGANGLDTGSLAASTMYNVFIIGDSSQNQPVAGLISLSLTAPTLPFGYDMFRRVGSVLTDSSSHILKFTSLGTDKTKTVYYDVEISELSAGNAIVYTPINLASSVPATATTWIVDFSYLPTVVSDVASFQLVGSTATTGLLKFGSGASGRETSTIQLPVTLSSGVPTVVYKVANAADSLTLSTLGYVDSL